MTAAPELVGSGAVFIDDIVQPDGTTSMGILGGGVIHALMGAALWDERPGLSAFIGKGLPSDILPFLGQYMDLDGVVSLQVAQARAWQIFEEDGTRHEIHRVPEIAPFVAGTLPENLPSSYKHAKSFYLLQDHAGIRRWVNSSSASILWEPNGLSMLPENHAKFRAALRECSIGIVSPNLKEARNIYGDFSPEALIDMLLGDGAKVAVLRMGADGVLTADRETGVPVYVKAVPVKKIVDLTGAGNAFNGAFLLGLMRDHSLREAAAMGNVAASFCVETIGVLDPAKCDRSERDRRYQLCF